MISGVPFVKQQEKQCGPAALASVLHYYGDTIRADEIAAEAFSSGLNGAMIFDLERVALSREFKARAFPASLEIVREHLKANEPVILLIDQGFSIYQSPHYLVAVGYDDQREVLTAHAGTEAGVLWPYERLEKAWSRMNHLCLIVRR